MIYNHSDQPLYVGYIACFIAVILFGSNLAVVKKYETGNGFFFNWVYCSAVWCIGLMVNLWQGTPPFYPLGMVGGIFWATGGLCVSIILRYIGLGLGVCIWATFNLIIGWACGRFGLFGIHPKIPQHEVMNYIACILSIISAAFYLSIQTEDCDKYSSEDYYSTSHQNLLDTPIIGGTYRHKNHSIPNDFSHPNNKNSMAAENIADLAVIDGKNRAKNGKSNDAKGHKITNINEINESDYSNGEDKSLEIALIMDSAFEEDDLLHGFGRNGKPYPYNNDYIEDVVPRINARSQPKLIGGRVSVYREPDNITKECNIIATDIKFKKRVIGSMLAILAGCLYGINFVPVIYIQDNYPHASKRGLPYIFSHFSGIYFCATLYFIAYACFSKIVHRKQPWINSALIIPTFVSGLLWAVATCAWFVANEILSQTISFPIIASLPPIIAGFWALFVFKEIKGRKNIILLLIAFSLSLTGAILSGFSF
ncbi:unnamed protein product [Gordionus sp. m RMFG-2023]|uniref:transmembrane protein 144-like n=1 Tax=Gordionus sp. m RMFG-2023 TaxID=3053472 RepID=UPI0030E3D967